MNISFGRAALTLTAGLFVVIGGVALFAFSEWRRERRHAHRPEAIVSRVLQLARLTSSDTLYDLECGDGAVVVTAAKQYGTRGWCFDIYAQRLIDARERARREGVEDLITFQNENWDSVDVTPASVVILWMTNPTGHSDYYKLRSQLTRELRAGSRIVSWSRGLGDWRPVEVVPIADEPHEPTGRAVQLWVADGGIRP